MKTILVTGGGGYIGSELTEALVKEGYRVRVFDAFYFGKAHLMSLRGPLELIEGDVQTFDGSLFKEVDAVIHLAAISNDPMADYAPKLCYRVNTHATEQLAVKAKKMGVCRFIFASSCSLYHLPGGNSAIAKENSIIHPISHYSQSKYQAENALLELVDKTFSVTIFRMATVGGYSKRLKFDLAVNTMVKSVLVNAEIIVFDGSQYRPLIDIRDVVQTYLLALKAPIKKIRGQIFNLAYENYLVSDLAKRVEQTVGKRGKKIKILQRLAEYETKSYKVSTEKIRKVLNIKPSFSAEDTVEYLLQQIERFQITDFDNPLYNNFLWTRPILAKLNSSL